MTNRQTLSRWFCSRRVAAASAVAVAFVILCFGVAQFARSQESLKDARRNRQAASPAAGYVGSQACAGCHREIYRSYSQTNMGRSMSEANAALLARIPTAASIYERRLNRHFETYASNGNLYQSEYETAADGKEVFRDTRKIEWIIGSGANGFGAIARHGNYLFEAPLSFYSKLSGWALSPGYEFGDYGFSRPILPGCVVCHSGRPQPILDGNGRCDT